MLLAMASETEKAHALLQTFSTASVISSLGLGIFCFIADRLLQFSFIQQHDWLRALSDNAVHGMVGIWSWVIVIGLRKKSDFSEVILAGFLSSVIDVDHFFLARSLSLQHLKMFFVHKQGILSQEDSKMSWLL
nr:transmembrane protein 267 isoform X3 [Chelonoidis abingdonii]